MKIIILGGYGVFGGRLCELLASDARLDILVAGRSFQKAQAFCSLLHGLANCQPLKLERDLHLLEQIKQIQPDLIIDASGPFQAYGEDPYRVVRACLAASINYMDFADGSEFVDGISQFDLEAKQKNLYILSGVSSFPVLTAAVVRHLSSGWKEIHSINAGIAPSPYAIVGLNVIKAISAYAGQPISLISGGKPSVAHAFTESRRYTISPPGKLPLKNTRFALVDVPDLKVLPKMWTALDSIWMGAGPTPEILLRMLNGLAWLVKYRLLGSLILFAPIFHFVISRVRWGEHRGGMFVEISGIDGSSKSTISAWHLLAEGDDGPYIPCMALEAIIHRTLNCQPPATGARPANSDLELSDYESLFSKRKIYTGCRDAVEVSAKSPVFTAVLGRAWEHVPLAIQKLHNAPSGSRFEGVANIVRGDNLMSKFIANLFGFPKAGKNIAINFTITKENGAEIWRRQFGNSVLATFVTRGVGRSEHLICERFGPFTFGIALILENGKLHYVVRNCCFFGLPLPTCLCPVGDSFEYETNCKFHFNIEIKAPMIGLIVRYQGFLDAKKAD